MSTLEANPPRGHFGVWQRLLRGYGPLAVFALMILLLSVLVPSKVHDDEAVAADNAGSGSGAAAAPPADPTFTVAVLGDPTGGTYTLKATLGDDTQETAPLQFNAAAPDLDTAIEALSNVGADEVTVTGAGPFTVVFDGDGDFDDVVLAAGQNNLTGGTSPGL
ncbi:MAG TPA: hypothetical protein VJ819_05885, partial [Nocardioidaceae bacterium]|nr:hypothetical protein [Nocardioidaceae bacterium]